MNILMVARKAWYGTCNRNRGNEARGASSKKTDQRRSTKMASKKLKVTCGADRREEEDRDRMLMEQLIQGSLCSNCRHQGDCGFLQKACAPILECELYECGLSEKPRLMVVRKTGAPAEAQPEIDDALLGLCINCENLRGCNLPKPAAGVWMCEEYR
jgi:hypothetical protein